jgi:hypothetical protein
MGCSGLPGIVPGLRHAVLAAAVIGVAAASLACGGGKLPSLATPSVTRTNVTLGTTSLRATATRPPGTTTVTASATTKPAAGATAPSQFQTSRYTVVEGDNPGLIAEKVGVPADRRPSWITEMLALNGVTATTLQIGQELVLPPFDSAGPLPTQSTSSGSGASAKPAATEAPAATDTPAPTATQPTATATQPAASPTVTGTVPPGTLNLISVTSPVKLGSDVTLVIQTAPATSCRLAYNNPNGTASQAAGLGTKTAGNDGKVSWTWTISPNTSPGTGSAYVMCGTNGLTVTIQTTS